MRRGLTASSLKHRTYGLQVPYSVCTWIKVWGVTTISIAQRNIKNIYFPTFSDSKTCLWTIKPQGCGALRGEGGLTNGSLLITAAPPPTILSSDVERAVTLTTTLINRELSVNQCRGCVELWSRQLRLCYCVVLGLRGGGEGGSRSAADGCLIPLTFSVGSCPWETDGEAIAVLPALQHCPRWSHRCGKTCCVRVTRTLLNPPPHQPPQPWLVHYLSRYWSTWTGVKQ